MADHDAPEGVLQRLRRWARRIKRDGLTLWFAVRHADTPMAVKLLGAFVVAYALSPIDLIPDFIPVVGNLDDVLLLLLVRSTTGFRGCCATRKHEKALIQAGAAMWVGM